jgi:hypothetical protein
MPTSLRLAQNAKEIAAFEYPSTCLGVSQSQHVELALPGGPGGRLVELSHA